MPDAVTTLTDLEIPSISTTRYVVKSSADRGKGRRVSRLFKHLNQAQAFAECCAFPCRVVVVRRKSAPKPRAEGTGR